MKKPIKRIEIKLTNDTVYEIDAHKVAHDRATHYMEDDSYPSPEEAYREEYGYAITEPEELSEWLSNNMDWYELDPVFVRDEREVRLPRLEIHSKSFFSDGE